MGVSSEPAGGAAATVSAVKKDNSTDVEATGHTAPSQTLGQDARPVSVSECQLNLLGHVESVHRQISGRMDLIERELDGKHTSAWLPMLLRAFFHYNQNKGDNRKTQMVMQLLSPPSALLAVLESWLDHSGELEPPDPLSRLPQLKQRIRRLLCDLCTVRRLSVWH